MKDLNDVHKYLLELELNELANHLAITRYKASMWDKYNSEERIESDLLQAIEVSQILDELRAEVCKDLVNKTDLNVKLDDENYRLAEIAAESGGGLIDASKDNIKIDEELLRKQLQARQNLPGEK